MTEEIINLKDYFIHHYDDWGRLYCVEFKGSPLELEDSIKRLEQENEMIINEYNKLQAEIIGDMEFKEIMLTGITPLKVLQNLKERNRELQAFYDVHESFKTDFDTNRKLLDNYRSALEEIREKAQHCITQDVCALCDYSKECAVPDEDGLVYDNNRLLIKLVNEVLQ